MTLSAWLNPTAFKAGSDGNMVVFSFGSGAGVGGAGSSTSPWTALFFNSSTSTILVQVAQSSDPSQQTLIICRNVLVSLGSFAHVAVTLQKNCLALSGGCAGALQFAVYVNGMQTSCAATLNHTYSTLGAAWRTSAFLGAPQTTFNGRYAGYIGDTQAGGPTARSR